MPLPNIRGTQVGWRDPNLVDRLKADMTGGRYAFDEDRGRIGGVMSISNGTYHVIEGHHRMAAALEIYGETGDEKAALALIDFARWSQVQKPPVGSRPFPSRSIWGPFATGLDSKWESRMDDHCIDSQGFCVGGWGFPPFSLRRGECITLNLPQEARTDHESIVATLTGSKPVVGLTSTTVSFSLNRPSVGRAGDEWFHDPTPWDWLKENTTLSDDAIQTILIEYEMDRRIPLSRYAGTPRLILGLHAAYARNPAVIVFVDRRPGPARCSGSPSNRFRTSDGIARTAI